MKTQPQRSLPATRDEVSLADEVLVVRGSGKPRRMLASLALTALPELMALGEPFHVRRLTGEDLARFDGETLHGRLEIIVSLKEIHAYLADYVNVRCVAAVRRALAQQAEHDGDTLQEPADSIEGDDAAMPKSPSA